jgi:hypothetical protein
MATAAPQPDWRTLFDASWVPRVYLKAELGRGDFVGDMVRRALDGVSPADLVDASSNPSTWWIEGRKPADDMHLSMLCGVGIDPSARTADDIQARIDAMTQLQQETEPDHMLFVRLTGEVALLGDETDKIARPVVLRAELSPALAELRAVIKHNVLSDSDSFDFTPHVTVCYARPWAADKVAAILAEGLSGFPNAIMNVTELKAKPAR